MNIAFRIHGKLSFLKNPADVSLSIDEFFRIEEVQKTDAQAAWLAMDGTDSRHKATMLEVSANLQNGLSGAVWSVWEESDRFRKNSSGEILDQVYISDSGNIPDSPPEVLSDAHCPSYFDPCGVIPQAKMRKVIEEYCELQGHRPRIIDWTLGQLNGSRFS